MILTPAEQLAARLSQNYSFVHSFVGESPLALGAPIRVPLGAEDFRVLQRTFYTPRVTLSDPNEKVNFVQAVTAEHLPSRWD